MIKIAFLVLLTGSVALAQTTRPATRPSTRPSTRPTAGATTVPAVANKPTTAPAARKTPVAPMPTDKTDITARAFLDRGLKQLDSGDNDGAKSTFTDGLAVYGESAGSSANDSATKAALNHALAVANLRLNALPAARTSMEKARSAKWSNDTLVYNIASIQVALKGQAQNAVAGLDKYLSEHADADETWVNLYGLALEKGATDSAARKKLATNFKNLDTYQARLEKTRPGMHRWGNTWKDATEWADLKPKADAAKTKIDALQQKVDAAQTKVTQAQQRLAQQSSQANRSSGGGGGGGRRGRGGGSPPPQNTTATPQNQLSQAKQELAKAQQELQAADKGPLPPWDMPLVGMLPAIQMEQE